MICATCIYRHKEWYELPCDSCCGSHSGYKPDPEAVEDKASKKKKRNAKGVK